MRVGRLQTGIRHFITGRPKAAFLFFGSSWLLCVLFVTLSVSLSVSDILFVIIANPNINKLKIGKNRCFMFCVYFSIVRTDAFVGMF